MGGGLVGGAICLAYLASLGIQAHNSERLGHSVSRRSSPESESLLDDDDKPEERKASFTDIAESEVSPHTLSNIGHGTQENNEPFLSKQVSRSDSFAPPEPDQSISVVKSSALTIGAESVRSIQGDNIPSGYSAAEIAKVNNYQRSGFNPSEAKVEAVVQAGDTNSIPYNLGYGSQQAEALIQTFSKNNNPFNSDTYGLQPDQTKITSQPANNRNAIFNSGYNPSQYQKEALAQSLSGSSIPYSLGYGFPPVGDEALFQAISGSRNPYNYGQSISQVQATTGSSSPYYLGNGPYLAQSEAIAHAFGGDSSPYNLGYDSTQAKSLSDAKSSQFYSGSQAQAVSGGNSYLGNGHSQALSEIIAQVNSVGNIPYNIGQASLQAQGVTGSRNPYYLNKSQAQSEVVATAYSGGKNPYQGEAQVPSQANSGNSNLHNGYGGLHGQPSMGGSDPYYFTKIPSPIQSEAGAESYNGGSSPYGLKYDLLQTQAISGGGSPYYIGKPPMQTYSEAANQAYSGGSHPYSVGYGTSQVQVEALPQSINEYVNPYYLGSSSPYSGGSSLYNNGEGSSSAPDALVKGVSASKAPYIKEHSPSQFTIPGTSSPYSSEHTPSNYGYSFSPIQAFSGNTLQSQANTIAQSQNDKAGIVHARVIPQSELISPQNVPGAENSIACARDGEFHELVTSHQCLLCSCVRVSGILRPVCASCSHCAALLGPKNLSVIPNTPGPQYKPEGSLAALDTSSCAPLPFDVPFQHPLNPCQICVCVNSATGDDIHISCVDNPQCVNQTDIDPLPSMPVPPAPVPTLLCHKFPKNVGFPHPKDTCKDCKCFETLSPSGIPEPQILCTESIRCEIPTAFSFKEIRPGSSLEPYNNIIPPNSYSFPQSYPIPYSKDHSFQPPFFPTNPPKLNNLQTESLLMPEFSSFAREKVIPEFDPISQAPFLPSQYIPVLPETLVQPESVTISSSEAISYVPFDSPPGIEHVNPDPHSVLSELLPIHGAPSMLQPHSLIPIGSPISDILPWPPITHPETKRGPLLGPPPHKSCKPYPTHEPFQHPWDDCQICTCGEYHSSGDFSVEVNCYTKSSCCVEAPIPPRALPASQPTGKLPVGQSGQLRMLDKMCEFKTFGAEFLSPLDSCTACSCQLFGTYIVPVCTRLNSPQCSTGTNLIASSFHGQVIYLEPRCQHKPPNKPFVVACNVCVCQSVFNYVIAKCTPQPNCRGAFQVFPSGGSSIEHGSAYAQAAASAQQQHLPIYGSSPSGLLPPRRSNENTQNFLPAEAFIKPANYRAEPNLIRSLHGPQPDSSYSSAEVQAYANYIPRNNKRPQLDNLEFLQMREGSFSNAVNNDLSQRIGIQQYLHEEPRQVTSSLAEVSVKETNDQGLPNSILPYYGHGDRAKWPPISFTAASSNQYPYYNNNQSIEVGIGARASEPFLGNKYDLQYSSLKPEDVNRLEFERNQAVASTSAGAAVPSGYSPYSNSYPYEPDTSASPLAALGTSYSPTLLSERTMPLRTPFYTDAPTRLDSTTQAYSQGDASTEAQKSASTASAGTRSGRGQCQFAGDMYHHRCQACYCRADASSGGALYSMCMGKPCS